MSNTLVTVRVPATTANLGPGFDTLGIALKLHNHVTVTRQEGPDLVLQGANGAPAPPPAQRMIREVAAAFFKQSKNDPHGAAITIKGDVPVSRGLGSSVTVRLGLAYALNEMNGRPLADAALLDLVAALEGHPDNCAPALFGGFVVSGVINGTVRHRRFSLPSALKFVCCIPDLEVPTERARALLPKRVEFADAVANINRTALLTATIASGDFSLLRGLFEDRLHQTYRKQLLPQLDDVIAAGTAAGALGGWLSGSGSCLICLTEQNEKAVAAAMLQVLTEHQVDARVKVFVADNDGTRAKRD